MLSSLVDLLELATLFFLCVVNNLPLSFILFVAFATFAAFFACTAFVAFVAFVEFSMVPSVAIYDATQCDNAAIISSFPFL